jgi:hypothetical protein
MPANFPEIWLTRVIENITTTDSAPWLDGITEVESPVVTFGAGTQTEKNVVHIPRSNFNPDVLINNTTYPIALQDYTDDEVVVALDKYQTKATSLSDDDAMGASYDKIDVITSKHTKSMQKTKYRKALHAIAPSAAGTDKFVIATTGANDGTGRKRMRFEDLVAIREQFANMADGEGIVEGIRLVLSAQHEADMMLDRERFADKFVNHASGKVAPMIAGLKVYTYAGSPLYANDGTKKAYGAAKVATDSYASVAFLEDNIAKKTGNTKQYFSKAEDNPTTQSNALNYRHYFMAVPAEDKYIGAVVNGTV